MFLCVGSEYIEHVQLQLNIEMSASILPFHFELTKSVSRIQV